MEAPDPGVLKIRDAGVRRIQSLKGQGLNLLVTRQEVFFRFKEPLGHFHNLGRRADGCR
jgi:hypothetical protein